MVGKLGTVPKSLVRGLEELEIGERAKIIQIKSGQKSLGDLRRLTVTQTPKKDNQLKLMRKKPRKE